MAVVRLDDMMREEYKNWDSMDEDDPEFDEEDEYTPDPSYFKEIARIEKGSEEEARYVAEHIKEIEAETNGWVCPDSVHNKWRLTENDFDSHDEFMKFVKESNEMQKKNGFALFYPEYDDTDYEPFNECYNEDENDEPLYTMDDLVKEGLKLTSVEDELEKGEENMVIKNVINEEEVIDGELEDEEYEEETEDYSDCDEEETECSSEDDDDNDIDNLVDINIDELFEGDEETDECDDEEEVNYEEILFMSSKEMIRVWNTKKDSFERAAFLQQLVEMGDEENVELTLTNFLKAYKKKFKLTGKAYRKLLVVFSDLLGARNIVDYYLMYDIIFNMPDGERRFMLLNIFLNKMIRLDYNKKDHGMTNYHEIYEMPLGKYNREASYLMAMYEFLCKIKVNNNSVCLSHDLKTLVGLLQYLIGSKIYAIPKDSIDEYGIEYYVAIYKCNGGLNADV